MKFKDLYNKLNEKTVKDYFDITLEVTYEYPLEEFVRKIISYDPKPTPEQKEAIKNVIENGKYDYDIEQEIKKDIDDKINDEDAPRGWKPKGEQNVKVTLEVEI